MYWPLTTLTQRFTCTQKQLPTVIKRLSRKGYTPILDYAVEIRDVSPARPLVSARTSDTAHVLFNAFQTYPNSTFALKWSSLGYDTQLADDVLGKAIENNVTLLLDAERHDAYAATSELADRWMRQYNQPDLPIGVYKTYQMYRRDALAEFSNDLLDPQRTHALGIKLVRGAYLHEEQHMNVLCQSADETHAQYDQAVQLFAQHHKPADVLMCATHNLHSIVQARALQMDKNNLTFAQLMGLGDSVSDDLVHAGYKTYKYVPFGPFWETMPYLVRRAYEHMSTRHLMMSE
jgi:hypothetical protein